MYLFGNMLQNDAAKSRSVYGHLTLNC